VAWRDSGNRAISLIFAKSVGSLKQQDFSNVHNLACGINAWADGADPKMPKC